LLYLGSRGDERMSERIVVAQCGRDKAGNVIDEGQHLAEAIYLKNQPEGDGWFIPPLCPECEAKALDRLADPAAREEIDAYIESPEFEKLTDDVEAYAAYRRIMRQE
jgi:hypothetical protein